MTLQSQRCTRVLVCLSLLPIPWSLANAQTEVKNSTSAQTELKNSTSAQTGVAEPATNRNDGAKGQAKKQYSEPESKSTTASEEINPEPRTLAEIHQDLRRLERQTSRAKDDQERAANIVALCELFIEVGEHPDITKSPTLQSLSVRLRTRLRGIERRTETELKKRKIPEPDFMVAQRKQENRERANGNHFSYASNRSSYGSNQSSSGTDASAPGNKSMGGNQAPGPDYGWVLVNLIRQTIRPEYWSVAGGPGKAIYYGNARALVIHGSWRIQEDVADLLTALRGG